MKKLLSLALICALMSLSFGVSAEMTPRPETAASPPAVQSTPDASATPEITPHPSPTPRPTAAPALVVPPPVPTVDNSLRRGASGDEVKQIQNRLRILGFMTGSADGHYGPVTEKAVVALREYMQELALVETAGQGLETRLPDIVDDILPTPAPAPAATAALSEPEAEEMLSVVDGEDPEAAEYSETEGIVDDTIRHLLLREGFEIFRDELSRGSEGWEVTRLQNRLNTLHYLYGGVDGEFGKKTETAVSAFQKANGLPKTGVADEETQRRLYSETAKEAPIPANPYVLKISVADQRVYAYAYDVGTGSYSKLVRTMICSTGLKDTPTPYGTFSSAGPVARWGYFPKWDVYAQYLFRITGGILFHSVLYQTSEESSLIQGSVSKLGSRASHGCIRLKVEDAKWIYNNCPAGTTVIVY